MSIRPLVHQPIVRSSEATLVLETASSSIWALTIGRSYSHATCVRGSLTSEVAQAALSDIDDSLRRMWTIATGFAGTMGADLATADSLAQQEYADRRYTVRTQEGTWHTTEVQVARWVHSTAEILAPRRSISREFAKVFVTHGNASHPLPVMTNACSCCEYLLDLASTDDYSLSRVNGDSRWGYEPTCYACIGDPMAAEGCSYGSCKVRETREAFGI